MNTPAGHRTSRPQLRCEEQTLTITELTTTAEVLRRAADEIDRRGLWQGDYMPDGADPETCPVCAMGAITAALCGMPRRRGCETEAQYRLFGAALTAAEYEIGRGQYLHHWNDREGRTAAEVAAMFRAAADRAA